MVTNTHISIILIFSESIPTNLDEKLIFITMQQNSTILKQL